MRAIVVGLGIQGTKRAKVAGSEVVATVDTAKPEARYWIVEEVPLASYDAALVCTPDEPKFDVLSYLLRHGKHVLVEKPLMMADDQQLFALKKLAREQGVVCYTAYNHRFEPFLVRAKEIIQTGKIGEVLSLRMFYGNGTAREVRNSAWRDSGMGVLADLGSHLLDTTAFLLEAIPGDLHRFSYYSLENRAYDYVIFGSRTARPRLQLEATLLSWRNTFSLDVIGSEGSVHVDCLCKWGPSTLTIRQRVLPSGRPLETSETLACPDPTWELEYKHFCRLTQESNRCGLVEDDLRAVARSDIDLWINRSLRQLFAE